MNIYFVNRNSKYKGPFDIIDHNREHIIKVGDVCLLDSVEGVAFLVVCNFENSWKACKRVGVGDNNFLSKQGNTLLFSFDGLSKRRGDVGFIQQLSDCFREKVIVDFFANAIDILERRRDFWDASLFGRFFESSQEIIVREEPIKACANSTDGQLYPSVFAKYLDKESLGILTKSIKEGSKLREAYGILREKDPKSFRAALLSFLAENPTRTIYDKLPVAEIPVKPKVEAVKQQSPVQEQKSKVFAVSEDVDRPFFYNHVEFKKLYKLYKKGDKKALDRLIEVNRSLVVSIARRYKGRGVDFKDLVQEGTIGLIRALEHFDDTKSYRFDFYAGFWIARYIINAINQWGSLVRIPLNLISAHRKITIFKEKYEQQYGHQPAYTDIETDSDVKLEKIAYLDQLPSLLHEVVECREDMDCFPSDHSFVENYDKLNYNRYFINKLFTFISPRSRTIVEACYGLGDYKGRKYTLEEVGDMFGLTRERCRQILEKSVRIMRDIARKKIKYGEVGTVTHYYVDQPVGIQYEFGDVIKHGRVVKIQEIATETNQPRIDSKRALGEAIDILEKKTPASNTQGKIDRKDALNVGDNIYYDNNYCTVREIVNDTKTSYLVIEYLNLRRDRVPYDKSRYTKISSPRGYNHVDGRPVSRKKISKKKVVTTRNNDDHNIKAYKEVRLLNPSTSLKELVDLHIITYKQLKHCYKRNLKTIGDVVRIIRKYDLTPDSTRFTRYTLDMWFAIAKLSNTHSDSMSHDEPISSKVDDDRMTHPTNPIVSSDPDIKAFADLIDGIRQAKIQGEVIVAKPVLLLSVIDGITTGTIKNNKIVLDQWLEQRYEFLMKIYTQNSVFRNFSPINNPFWHLQRDGLWHLSMPDIKRYVTPTTKWLREKVRYAYFDKAFWSFLQNSTMRQKLRDYIVKTKLANT